MTSMPTWEKFMIPVLKVLSDAKVRNRRELGPEVGALIGLSPEQMRETLGSSQLKYQNRMGWALSFLSIVGAISRPSRGNYEITDGGRRVLSQFPNGVTERELRALGADEGSPIQAYVPTNSRTREVFESVVEDSTLTPIEQVQTGVERIHHEIAAELIARLQQKDPAFFEQAVVDLLLKMGYGGVGGSGSVTSLSNDGGIDGVIDQDVLGLSRVYIQAKRYGDGNTVGRPEVQGFVGALSGKADSGVFITTSRFAQGAYDYANTVPTRIILIDGTKLAELMIRYDVGVQVADTYKVVEIDEDFFS